MSFAPPNRRLYVGRISQDATRADLVSASTRGVCRTSITEEHVRFNRPTGRYLQLLRSQAHRCKATQRIRLCRVRQHPCEFPAHARDAQRWQVRSAESGATASQDAEDAIKELDGRDFMGDR